MPKTRTSQDIFQRETQLIALGWSQRNIAERIARLAGVDHTTYRRWRNGENEPTLASWRRVMDAFTHIENGGRDDGKPLARRRRRKTVKARR